MTPLFTQKLHFDQLILLLPSSRNPWSLKKYQIKRL